MTMNSQHIKILLVTAITFLICIAGQSQCLKPIEEYLDRTASISSPTGSKVYFMEYSVETIPADGSKMPTSLVHSKVYKSSKRLSFKTDDIEIYEDEKDKVMIVHPSKRIIIDKPSKTANAMDASEVASIQKSILTSAKVLSCNKIHDNGSYILELKLECSKEIKEKYKIDFTNITFDLDENRIRRVESIFSKDHSLKRQITDYENLDFSVTNVEISTAKTVVFDTNGNLRPRLKSYAILNN